MRQKHNRWRTCRRLAKALWPYLIIIALTTVIELPQLCSGHIIIGADTLFHYNRFYDTAMQIKHLNFSYWIMLYGFHHAGRIVNAVYSPFLAYLLGGVLLICHSFYHFQILTDYLIPILAGLGLQVGFHIANIHSKRNKILVAFYPFVYQVFHWNISTNFTSVGAIVLPLVVGCLVGMLRCKQRPIVPIQFGTLLALVAQLHFVTTAQALLLCVLIIPPAFFANKHKGHFIASLLGSAIIALVLVSNLIGGLLELYTNNHISPLYALRYGSDRSYVYSQGANGLFTDTFVLVIMVIIYLIAFKAAKPSARYIGFLALIFFFMSTTLLPWRKMMVSSPIFGFFQYPSRFLVPAVVLASFYLAMTFRDDVLSDEFRVIIYLIISIGLIFSVFSNFRATQTAANDIVYGVHIYPKEQDKAAYRAHLRTINSAFNSDDFAHALKTAYMGTPDYMPLTHKFKWSQAESTHWWENPSSHAYIGDIHDIYLNDQVIHGQDRVSCKIKKHRLVFKIKNPRTTPQKLLVPAVAYNGTQASIQGQPIDTSPSSCDQALNMPQTMFQPGVTKVTIKYRANPADNIFAVVGAVAWTGCLIYFGSGFIGMAWHDMRSKHWIRINELKSEATQ